jgi:hypothetical protein
VFSLWIDRSCPAAAAAFQAVRQGEVGACSVEMILHEIRGNRVLRAGIEHIALVDSPAYPNTVVFAVDDDDWDLPPLASRLIDFWWPSAASRRAAPPAPSPVPRRSVLCDSLALKRPILGWRRRGGREPGG